MKPKLPLLLWLLCVALVGRAQQSRSYIELTKLVQPPGAVWVQDSLWMDEAEVVNLHWLEFLHFLRRDSSEAQYQSALPDSLVWRELGGLHDPYVQYYFRYPGFRYYPMVGISYQQAARYCRWRSAVVNQNLHNPAYLKKHPKLRGYEFRVEYRLPTVREWELAAGGMAVTEQPYGNVFPPPAGSRRYRQELLRISKYVGFEDFLICPLVQAAWQAKRPVFTVPFNVREKLYTDDLRQAFNCPLAGSWARNEQTGFSDADWLTEYCYAYPPNPRGCYNMIGNVAELTATPGVAKGGSFWHPVRDCTVLSALSYAAPQMWLGFRCACTVYIEPKK